MDKFKSVFGGEYTKENGKIYWLKNGVKELVTMGFLNYFISNKKDPSVNDQSQVVSKVVSTVVSKTVSTVKQPPKKVKKDAKVATNPEVPEGS
jgi:hypothetical protein